MIKATLPFITSILLVLASVYPSIAQAAEVLHVNLHFKDGKVSLVSVSRKSGEVPNYQGIGEQSYTLTVENNDRKQLFKTEFVFPTTFHGENFQDKIYTRGSLSEVDTSIIIPLIKDAKDLKITNAEGFVVVDFDLTEIVNANFTTDTPSAADKKISPYIFLISALIVFIIIGLYFVRKKRTQGVPNAEDEVHQ